MELGALIIFLLVYIGMILGNWPGLAIDRTGIALLGAITFILLQDLSLTQTIEYIDLSTIAILFSFMIISAQFYFSGFYTYIANRIIKWKLSPSQLLFVVIFISAALSAVLLNDIICLALTPLVIHGCSHKKLNPLPYLIGLCCASNIGSSLTLIGNPQNILIGQVLTLPFAQYMKYSIVPSFLGVLATWAIIHWRTKGCWHVPETHTKIQSIPFLKWQSIKGLALISLVLILFIFFNIPRDHISLIAAGLLLLSRRMTSHTMLNFIDWQLLVLFIGLFIVNKAFLSTYPLDSVLTALQNHNIHLDSPFWVFIFSIILSNVVSNVPAVMLLLPFIHSPLNGSLLAISSTLAGNLFIIGSIANIIVISQASAHGVKISWKKHLIVGLPLSMITLGITALWFYVIA